MKSLFKKINVLAVVAMLVGGGFAFAAQSNYQAPNTYLDPIDNQWKDLGTMEEGKDYRCVESASACVGFRDDPNSQHPSNIEEGTFLDLR